MKHQERWEHLHWFDRIDFRRKSSMPFRNLEDTTQNSTYQWLAALMLFSMCLLQGPTTSPLELVKQPTPPANEHLPYGKGPLQYGEMRLPSGTGLFPVAILVH